MGPKLINCCMLEPMGTEDFGKNGEKESKFSRKGESQPKR